MLGSLFALAAESMLRASLACATLASARPGPFAGEVAVVLHRPALRQEPCSLSALAVGLGLRPQAWGLLGRSRQRVARRVRSVHGGALGGERDAGGGLSRSG